MKKIKITENFLIKEYLENKQSAQQISNMIGCSDTSILRLLKKYNIPIRNTKQSNIKNIIDQHFGRLTVLEFIENNKNGAYWKCMCNCGNIIITSGASLRRKHTQSCGCFQKEQNKNTKYKGGEYITGSEFNHIGSNAKIRNLEFNITIEDIEKIYEKQNKKCILTRRKLEFNTGRHKPIIRINGTASVDRIDSSKGYTVNNIQIVHKDVNIAKNSLSQEDFIKLCKEVAANN